MKKNFLKKLSLVLACAMTVSMTAPAADAFAATAPSLSAKSVVLHLGVKGKTAYNFNIKNGKSTYKQQWYVGNSKVLSVKKTNGVVTAKAAGTTKIGAKITNKKTGKVIKKLYATVYVRDNIASLTITNTPANNTLKVGQENDFNRSFVAKSGSTTKTSGITRWTVDNTTGASITDAGVFKATTAGEYTITANAFQSKTKYNAWLADKTKNAANVTATASYKVKVTSGMVSAVQKDIDEVKVTFDSAVKAEDVKANIALSSMVGSTKVSALVKEVKMDADNKVATVKVYSPFTGGSTYVVDYKGMTAVQFVAATTNVEDVTEIAITTTQVQVQKETEVNVALYNKNKVDITTDELKNRVNLELTANKGNVTLNNDGKIYMYNIGDTANLTATFHTYKNDTAGKEIAFTATGVVTCVKEVVDTVKAIDVYTIGDANEEPVFHKDLVHNVALNDENKQLFVRYTITKADGTEEKEDNFKQPGKFTFKTNNSRVLNLDNNGHLIPANIGTAEVLVSYNDVVVGAVEVSVGKDRELATFTTDSTKVTLSNSAALQDSATITMTAKDQYGKKYTAVTPSVDWSRDYTGAPSITFDGMKAVVTPGAKGTFYGNLVLDDNNSKVVQKVYFSVVVDEPGTAVAGKYGMGFDKSDYNMALKAGDRTSQSAKISLYTLDSRDIKVSKVQLAENMVTVTNSAGTVSGAYINVDGKDIVVNLTPVSGGFIKKLETGSYKVAIQVDANTKVTKNFYVSDNQIVPVVSTTREASEKKTAAEAFKDCYAITFDGKNVTNDVVLGKYTETSNTVTIKTVIYDQPIATGAVLRHEIKINNTIEFNK